MAGYLIIPVTEPPLSRAIANITIEYDSNGLIRLRFNQIQTTQTNVPQPSNCHYLRPLLDQLTEYLRGNPTRFCNVPLHFPASATPFQKAVWSQTSLIPYATVTTYSQLAQRAAGSPSYARAVGGALGANPFPIVIPCHRVLAANGSLGGFSAGLGIKKALLAVERTLQ